GTPDQPVEGARYRLESRTYDINGNLIERIVYGGVGGQEVIEHAVYSSDSEGNRSEKSYTGGSGIPDSSISQPAPVKEDRGPDGAYLYRYVFKYNDKGNRTEESVYRGGGAFVYKVEYSYSGNGQLIKRQTTQADGSNEIVSYTYMGTLTTPGTVQRNGQEKVGYADTLDRQGNWTARVSYVVSGKKDKIIGKTYRTITYYDGSARLNEPSRNVVRPFPINAPQPRYSDEARNRKTQGAVIMRILVGEDGLVKQIVLTQGLPYGLNEQAALAASNLKFKPATIDGKPIQFWQAVMIEFKLK